ncbi:MAG: hypothetical protein L6455_10075, partial [Kiritimatiellae bacterium]|nr:hypothetical protein [Verrucomicrobiota bacterium]MBU4291901.1 hypothetical protein [Verrucomicrobiota bacterium]MCG2680296.1 hypothetical protein [Kiritimatiellia bacterium]
LPIVYIQPLLTNVCINSGNVNFYLGGASRVTNGVSWSIIPDGVTNGAVLTGYPSNAVVAVGGVATTYVVRATANENTNIYASAVLNVLKVDIVQTNQEGYVYCTNCVSFWLTADSYPNVTWSISPDLGTNGAQFASGQTWTGVGANTWQGTNVWVYAGPASNTYTVTAQAVGNTNCFDTATFEVFKPQFVDFNWLESTNEALHHTSLYQTNALVLRRADKFKVEAKLSNGYESASFDVWFQAVQDFDGSPTIKDVPEVIADLGATDWYCKLLSVSNNADQTKTVKMEINIPSTNCPIGEYQWQALVSPKAATNLVLDATNFPGQVIVLFNPWSANDSVYMADDDERAEYVMNIAGLLWHGELADKFTMSWDYEQFNTVSLGVLLSELSGQDAGKRVNSIFVSRHLSARVNCNDGGILWGLWPTNDVWPDGTNADYWAGSDEILAQYQSTGDPVKYGQCWVFAGLLTTMLRCSGIPARPITTYDSAHDTNGNQIVERRCDTNGVLDRSRSEKIWNFHVWCDAWMDRPDQTGQNGWQAVDATPQELSAGAFQCGPASHVAVRGNLGSDYDVAFVYAEVDADVEEWWDFPGGGEVLVDFWTAWVGHDISTKSVGANTTNDITSSYK